MAQRSDELKREIEQTRERMGETADALAYKADVPSRTKEWVDEKKDSVAAKLGGVAPSRDEISSRVQQVKAGVERNPLGLAIGGVAAGFLVGLLVPSTRIEDERVRPMADDVKSTASGAGREALMRGREVVQEAGEAAVQTVVERGRRSRKSRCRACRSRHARRAPPSAKPRGRPRRRRA